MSALTISKEDEKRVKGMASSTIEELICFLHGYSP